MSASLSRETTLEKLASHVGKPAVVPITRELVADTLTPVSAFLKVCANAPHHFLLESVEGGERWARYSFLGLDPHHLIRARDTRCEVEGAGALQEERADPLGLLEAEIQRLEWLGGEELPRFAGGAVGWLSWEAVRWWEPLGPRPDPGWTLHFMVPRSLLIFDNLKHRILAVRLVFCEEIQDASSAWDDAQQALDGLEQTLREEIPGADPVPASSPSVTPTFPRDEFEQAVEKIQAYIRAGDCIQAVLSQRFQLGFAGRPVDLYRALRAVNPSPYMFLVQTPEQTLIGASPEVMVRVQDGIAEVCPIAGTRRRGDNTAEDEALEAELRADPKEQAEHVMLVDLARNDLGRIGTPGTVEVQDLMHVERFSHVMHLVTNVRAQLAPGKNAFDAVRATFPAGTLSGAPKVRAMEILDELEPCARGVYGGAVGWFGFNGDVDLAIAIRTAWKQGDTWQMQVGAGIVADSVPAAEYQETLDKAGAVLRALEIAGRGL
jgi:anthranilate synthase component 1